MRRVRPAVAVLALLAGCTPVGPDYERPTLEAGAAYRAPFPELVGAAAVGTDWWQQFDDPLVAELIGRALVANLDVQAAESRIREAEALRRSVRSDRFPTLDAEAGADIGYTRRLRAEESPDPQAGASAGGFVGWTADLFGGQRRAEQAAAAEAARTAWLRQAVALDVAGEVAATYVDLRGLERRLVLGEESLALQQRTLQIVRGRVEAGLAPDLDLSRAEAAVSRLTADLVPIRTDIRLASDTIATLLGQPPSALSLPPSTLDGRIPRLAAGPAIGLPADLIRRRPDLRAAEFALIAATADIGVAEAELYPELTLPGRLTLSVDGLGTGDIVGTVIAALGATLDIPLFDAGSRQARVDAAEERARQALLNYRATLLSALAEVEAAMQSYAGAQERVVALDATVAANQRAVGQAQALYGGGLVNFIDVLDSQRDLTVSLQQRAAARTDLTLSAIDLYRAAGFAPCRIAGTDPLACPEGQSVG